MKCSRQLSKIIFLLVQQINRFNLYMPYHHPWSLGHSSTHQAWCNPLPTLPTCLHPTLHFLKRLDSLHKLNCHSLRISRTSIQAHEPQFIKKSRENRRIQSGKKSIYACKSKLINIWLTYSPKAFIPDGKLFGLGRSFPVIGSRLWSNQQSSTIIYS